MCPQEVNQMCQSLRNRLVNLQTEKAYYWLVENTWYFLVLTTESLQQGIILE